MTDFIKALIIFFVFTGQVLAVTNTITKDNPKDYLNTIEVNHSLDFSATNEVTGADCGFFSCDNDIKKGELFAKDPLSKEYRRFRLSYCLNLVCLLKTISNQYTFHTVGTYDIQATFTDKQDNKHSTFWQVIVKSDKK